MKNILIIVLLSSSFGLMAQSGQKLKLLPDGMNFQPLEANHQEARIGVMYITENRNLKVDIGNNIDLLGYSLMQEDINITAGIEFMAYALSTSYAGKRLQIDAVDGFFGGNISFRKNYTDRSSLQIRFRIIHNSAHLVDGHWDNTTETWIDNYKPIPYTKDFGEITFARQSWFTDIVARYYGGISYATLVRPASLKKWNYHAGFETGFENVFGKVFDKNTYLLIAAHIGISGEFIYNTNYNLLAGLKIGGWENKGVLFYISYYNGNDVFNSYYNRKVERLGLGFSVDFP